MTEQAYRYPKDEWSADEARAHCKEHEGSFEAAKGESGAEAVWSGVASAMLELYRESAAMEETSRRELYNVLERAYRKLGRVAPEYRSKLICYLSCERWRDCSGGTMGLNPLLGEKGEWGRC
jgi:hypothetical protein